MESFSSHRLRRLLLLLSSALFFSSFLSTYSLDTAPIKSLSLENPVLTVKPLPLLEYKSERGFKDLLMCGRVQVDGISRLKLKSYATPIRLTLAPSVVIPERLHSRIQVCLHDNSSLGLCQCEKDDWSAVHKGIWSNIISPYENRYIDVKFSSDLSGSVTITLEEEFQQWRLMCLAVGFTLLLLAPIVSSYVPFYYVSSMAIGVMLVVIILLFQGMRLLPTRKNLFYLAICGSVLRARSFLLHKFSLLVNSILVNFGLSQEMHSPVSMILLVLVVLAGAALGYWIVRKYVVSDDGSVDVGVAQFVKWAMRIVATTFILQGSPDTPLALGTVVVSWVMCSFITSVDWQDWWFFGSWTPQLRRTKVSTPLSSRAEFLSSSGKRHSQGKMWNSANGLSTWSGSPVNGLVSRSSGRKAQSPEYLSTYHKLSNRKKMSRKEWEDFTRDSTREAMKELASSPEFADWIIENADRIKLRQDDDTSDEEVVGSGSDSTEETAVQSGNRRGLFR